MRSWWLCAARRRRSLHRPSSEPYVRLKEDTDLSAVLPAYFSSLLADRRSAANVVFNEDLYSTIDTGAFYEKLVALRSEAAQEPAQAQQ